MRAPAGLRARFGVEVMAADVQKANYAGLNGRPLPNPNGGTRWRILV